MYERNIKIFLLFSFEKPKKYEKNSLLSNRLKREREKEIKQKCI